MGDLVLDRHTLYPTELVLLDLNFNCFSDIFVDAYMMLWSLKVLHLSGTHKFGSPLIGS